MQPHTKIYCDFFGYDVEDFVLCEITGMRAKDIHHIEARGMSGTSRPDEIENLMALTRYAHEYFGDKEQYMDWLKEAHKDFMETQEPLFKRRPGDKILREFIGTFGLMRFLM